MGLFGDREVRDFKHEVRLLKLAIHLREEPVASASACAGLHPQIDRVVELGARLVARGRAREAERALAAGEPDGFTPASRRIFRELHADIVSRLAQPQD